MTTVHYTGIANSGTWNDPKSWQGGTVPGYKDLALFFNSGSHLFDGPISAGTVMLLGSESISFVGTVNTSDTGFCAGIMVCQNATMTFDAGSTLNDKAGALLIGVNGVGTFVANGTVQQGTTINSANATLGRSAGIGLGTITINGATWNNSGVAFIGFNGTGVLNVQDGGLAKIGSDLSVAGGDGSSGTVTIKTGSTLSVGASAGLGTPRANAIHGGTATLNVDAGGTLNVSNWLVEGSKSSLDLNGGTVNTGTSGKGWIHVETGAVIIGHGDVSSTNNLLLDDGLIEAKAGTLEITSNVSGAGNIDIDANSTAKLDGVTIQTSQLQFVGSDASLEFLNTPRVTSQITGFVAGDKIIFDSVIDGTKWQALTGSLTLTSAGNTIDTLHLDGISANAMFDIQHWNDTSIITLHV